VPRSRRSDIPANEILAEIYEAGSSLTQIGEQFNASPSIVATRLRECGTVIRPAKPYKYKATNVRSDVLESGIIRRYSEGASMTELAAEYETALTTIFNRLKKSGITIRPRGGSGHKKFLDGLKGV